MIKKISFPILLQVLIYLLINILFIFKYFSRTAFEPSLLALGYTLVFLSLGVASTVYGKRISEKSFKTIYWLLLSLMLLAIVLMLAYIDPYSVRVDRWSAVTFFLDHLFQGEYPYAAHTHVSTTNFPSPFPVWYAINLPFYILGDVGIGLIFFLLLAAFSIRYCFSSYKPAFFFLLLLCMSPAYWWEVAVRSDSLSNAFLVFLAVLWFWKKNYSLTQNFYLSVFLCALLASTRMSAVLPLALFFFRPFVIELSLKRKIFFVLAVLSILFLTFSPFVFWDTHTWVFFSRNPFMSQSGVGNVFVLLLMIALGAFLAFRWEHIRSFFFVTSLFLFLFILSSQVTLVILKDVRESIFSDSQYDISYFSLCLPYCIAYMLSFHVNWETSDFIARRYRAPHTSD